MLCSQCYAFYLMLLLYDSLQLYNGYNAKKFPSLCPSLMLLLNAKSQAQLTKFIPDPLSCYIQFGSTDGGKERLSDEEIDDFGIRGISWKLEAYTAVIN